MRKVKSIDVIISYCEVNKAGINLHNIESNIIHAFTTELIMLTKSKCDTLSSASC